MFRTRVALAGVLMLVPVHGRSDAERVVPLFADPGERDRWSGYVFGTGGAELETRAGAIPVVEHLGRPALKIAVRESGSHWEAGIAQPGWTVWYLDTFVRRGLMRFEAAGGAGGERVFLGLADEDKDRSGPDESLTGLVPLDRYGPLTTSWTRFAIPVKDFLAADPELDLGHCVKVVIQPQDPSATLAVFLRDVAFRTDEPERPVPWTHVNQLGYPPDSRKVAKIARRARRFAVREMGTGRIVHEGEVRLRAERDPVAGGGVWEADFSALRRPGRYRVEPQGAWPSPSFRIGASLYGRLYRDAIRFFYLQRCGVDLPEAHAGEWARTACHARDAEAVPRDGGKPRDVRGGWHDAGDCNKYAGWTRHAVGMILDLHDRYPAIRTVELNIPGSGNAAPDLLEEAAFELDWLMSMRVREGPDRGRVLDRLTERAAPPDPAAGWLQEERRLLPPTAAATACAASNWARAARTFRAYPELEERAARYLEAAEDAYRALDADPAATLEQRLAAALPLYDATGSTRYYADAEAAWPVVGTPREFGDLDKFIWAFYDVAVCAFAARPGGEPLRERARAMVAGVARIAVEAWRKDPYGIPLWNSNHLAWGSNSTLGRKGYYALMTDAFAPDPDHVRLAEDLLHYYLGCNATGISMVSGYGARATDIYHTIFGGSPHARLAAPPGIIVGGVNQFNVRGLSAWPGRHFRPDPRNWTLTEPSIGYQGPFVFLAGAVAAAGMRGED